MTTAIAMPCLMGGIGVAADYASLYQYKSNLQSAVDSAALATAKEMSLSSANETALNVVAKSYVMTNAGEGNIVVTTQVDDEEGWVEVTASQYWSPLFLQYLDNTAMPVVSKAKAQLKSTGKICMVGLNTTLKKTVKLEKKGKLVGDQCGVYSNSTNSGSIEVGDNSEIDASFICSAGGIKGYEKASLTPTPVVDCPAIGDPLEGRPIPSYFGCTKTNHEIKGGTVTLYPGVYCDGLSIKDNAVVTMKPGIYVIKDDKFKVDGDSIVVGKGVGIFLTGDNALIDFKEKSTIDLTAMESGEMAGILMWGVNGKKFNDEDDEDDDIKHHKLSSNNARNLLGTIYFPDRALIIDSDGTVADQSAYTAIIANQIELKYGPTLVLNSNYEDTSVPVPDSLKGGDPYLTN